MLEKVENLFEKYVNCSFVQNKISCVLRRDFSYDIKIKKKKIQEKCSTLKQRWKKRWTKLIKVDVMFLFVVFQMASFFLNDIKNKNLYRSNLFNSFLLLLFAKLQYQPETRYYIWHLSFVQSYIATLGWIEQLKSEKSVFLKAILISKRK